MIIFLLLVTLPSIKVDKPKCRGYDSTIYEIRKYIKLVDEEMKIGKQISLTGKYLENDATILVNIGDSKIIFYKKGSEIVKYEVIYDGSHGNLNVLVYFKNRKAIYVRKSLEEFEPPKYNKTSKVIKKVVNEYYLSETKIIAHNYENGIIRLNQPSKLNLELKFIEFMEDINNYTKIIYDD